MKLVFSESNLRAKDVQGVKSDKKSRLREFGRQFIDSISYFGTRAKIAAVAVLTLGVFTFACSDTYNTYNAYNYAQQDAGNKQDTKKQDARAGGVASDAVLDVVSDSGMDSGNDVADVALQDVAPCKHDKQTSECSASVNGIVKKWEALEFDGYKFVLEDVEVAGQEVSGLFGVYDECGNALTKAKIAEGESEDVTIDGVTYEISVYKAAAGMTWAATWADTTVSVKCESGEDVQADVVPDSNDVAIVKPDAVEETNENSCGSASETPLHKELKKDDSIVFWVFDGGGVCSTSAPTTLTFLGLFVDFNTQETGAYISLKTTDGTPETPANITSIKAGESQIFAFINQEEFRVDCSYVYHLGTYTPQTILAKMVVSKQTKKKEGCINGLLDYPVNSPATLEIGNNDTLYIETTPITATGLIKDADGTVKAVKFKFGDVEFPVTLGSSLIVFNQALFNGDGMNGDGFYEFAACSVSEDLKTVNFNVYFVWK